MRSSLDGSVALGHLGVIRARGADATTFLQGQLTNDVAGLESGRTRLAGFCSAKGRLQASFFVWRAADDDVVLVCAKSVLAATLKRLSMFVLRARCKLTDATDELGLKGHVGSGGRADGEGVAAIDGLAPWERREVDGSTWVRLPDAEGVRRLLVAVPTGAMASTTVGVATGAAAPIPAGAATPAEPPGNLLSSDDAAPGLDRWRWLEVRSGVPLIEAATVDQFVPQMLNFELLGGIDFQKGCYPGQEIVARSQYRGTIKRRMFLFESEASLDVGQDVFDSADPGQPAGMVVNAAPGPKDVWSALVEVKLAALDAGTLHVGAPGGPRLLRVALPYAVD